MNIRIIIYCALISIFASAITPIFTLITYIPDEGEMVYDTTKEDEEKMINMSSEELDNYVSKHVKMKRLTGFERITYLFSRPSMVLYHKGLLLSTFAIVFSSTLTASFLTVKQLKKSKE